MERVRIDKYFVWQKNGHKPRHAHMTHASALKEAKRLAAKNPGKRFIIQKFHEKVFVEVEQSPSTMGDIMMENDMKKKVWAGVVSGEIQFFSHNPQGNVDGLQGYRQFNVTDQCTLVDDHGTNILANTTETQGGTDNAGSIEQSADNNGPIGGAAQQAQSSSGPQAA